MQEYLKHRDTIHKCLILIRQNADDVLLQRLMELLHPLPLSLFPFLLRFFMKVALWVIEITNFVVIWNVLIAVLGVIVVQAVHETLDSWLARLVVLRTENDWFVIALWRLALIFILYFNLNIRLPVLSLEYRFASIEFDGSIFRTQIGWSSFNTRVTTLLLFVEGSF